MGVAGRRKEDRPGQKGRKVNVFSPLSAKLYIHYLCSFSLQFYCSSYYYFIHKNTKF